jgi:hypothetical protein
VTRARALLSLTPTLLSCAATEGPIETPPPSPPSRPAAPAESPPIDPPDATAATPDSSAVLGSDAGAEASASAGDAAAETPPAPRKVTFRPSGPCVDPIADGDRRLSALGPDAPGGGGRVSVLTSDLDLDGDGNADLILNGGAWVTTRRSYAYVLRGKCGHFVGEIVTKSHLYPLTKLHGGLFDLAGPHGCMQACCPRSTVEEWRFDGRRYTLALKRTESRQCSIPPKF